MKVTLRIKHKDRIFEEDTDLPGLTGAKLRHAASEYVGARNTGLAIDDRFVLLSVQTKIPLV